MLKDPKPPMIPKETSLTTHPEASTKMYGIKMTVQDSPITQVWIWENVKKQQKKPKKQKKKNTNKRL